MSDDRISEATVGDASGMEYFARIGELMSGLDGAEVLRGFVDGIQGKFRNE